MKKLFNAIFNWFWSDPWLGTASAKNITAKSADDLIFRLGLLRIIICFGAILTVISQGSYALNMDITGPTFYYYDRLPLYFSLLNIEYSNPAVGMAFFLAAILSLLTAMIGYRFRLSLSIAIISIFYIHCARSAYNGNNHHVLYAWAHALLILLCSRAGEASPLVQPRAKKSISDWEANWPVRVMQLMLVLFYFSAGIAKFRGPTLGWISGGSVLQRILLTKWQPNEFPFDIDLMIAFMPHLCWIFSVGIVVLEFAMPLLLLRMPKINRLILLSLAAFHISTRSFTNVPFHYNIILLFAFIDPMPAFQYLKGLSSKFKSKLFFGLK